MVDDGVSAGPDPTLARPWRECRGNALGFGGRELRMAMTGSHEQTLPSAEMCLMDIDLRGRIKNTKLSPSYAIAPFFTFFSALQ